MSKSSVRSVIRLRGVRHNNLKNFDLDLPLNQLIVITGLSGSGKSSLAFDTLFAEGQRRYIETFSPYARQFFDRMDKPQVDSIEGIPPAIAIEQRNAVRTTRSTVGTMTEICDYMKVLWGHLAELHCRGCGKPVRQDTPQRIWTDLASVPSSEQRDALVVFDVPLTDKLPLNECLGLIAKQGYQRLLLNNEVVRLDDLSASDRRFKPLPAAVAVAIALGWSAFRALGRALTPTPVPIPGVGLRTDGPYRFVRHPIYSAILLAGTGFAVAIGTWWTVAALGVLGLFFFAKSRWEDRLLRAQYGAAWEEWASTTGALLPRPPR